MTKRKTKRNKTQSDAPPVFEESIGDALIDSARISVMAALHVLPPPPAFSQIVLPGEDPTPTVQDCLDQAAQWLDAARRISLVQSEPPTSLHVVKGAKSS